MEGILWLIEMGTWKAYTLSGVIFLVGAVGGYFAWLKLDKIFKIDKWVTKKIKKVSYLINFKK